MTNENSSPNLPGDGAEVAARRHADARIRRTVQRAVLLLLDRCAGTWTPNSGKANVTPVLERNVRGKCALVMIIAVSLLSWFIEMVDCSMIR